MEYTIIIKNDMIKEYRIKAENVHDALSLAKDRFRESDVTAFDSNGEQRRKPLQDNPKVIRFSPEKPTARDKEPTKKERMELLAKNCPD